MLCISPIDRASLAKLALGYLNKTDETFFDDMTINSNLQLNNESKTNLYVSEKNVDNNKVTQ